MTSGVALTCHIICLPLQLSCRLCRLQGTTVGRSCRFSPEAREGVPPGYSQASEMGPQSSHYAQECYLWCRPCRLICAFLQLHLALPGRAPGLTYHRQGHMSCQPSEGQ